MATAEQWTKQWVGKRRRARRRVDSSARAPLRAAARQLRKSPTAVPYDSRRRAQTRPRDVVQSATRPQPEAPREIRKAALRDSVTLSQWHRLRRNLQRPERAEKEPSW